jgi:hypothetical protein
MNWPIKEYPIENLKLDQYNIRTPISDEDQHALIRDMFANEDAFELVKSYVQNGTFPDEFPIIIEENDKFIVIEGNRRLAALKALDNPDIVPSYEKRIRALDNPGIESIRVVLSPDRESAIKHIANKHTIDFRRPWRPLRQAYFYKSQLDNGKTLEQIANEFPEHNIPRFIKMLEMHHIAKSMTVNDSLKDKIHDDRAFPITTLERFYEDKNVTKFLGVEFDDFGRVTGHVDKAEFEKGFTKLVEDIATGEIDSRQFNVAKQRESYLEMLPEQYKPDLSKEGSFTSADFKIQPVLEGRPKRKVKTSKRIPKGLFFQADVPYNLGSTSLRIVYNELRDINVYYFPNATHELIRSFLECALLYYLKETNEYRLVAQNERHNPTLSDMLKFVASEKCKSIDDDNIKKVASQIRADWTAPYSLERMNMTIHNENWNSTEYEVRSAWGKVEGLIKILLNPKK